MKRDISKSDPLDLVKEQESLVAMMEASMDPQVLFAVEHAYHANFEEEQPTTLLSVSYEGTTYA